MSDLISRKALCEYALNQKGKSVTPNDIMRFPPAQPKKRTEERTETHGVCLDAIDRQAAIDAMCAWFFNLSDNRRIDEVLNEVPSAQPEVLACGEGELIAQPEIIRCKDCKHSRFFDPCFYCYEFGGEIIVSENGYCYKAERRTDERPDQT